MGKSKKKYPLPNSAVTQRTVTGTVPEDVLELDGEHVVTHEEGNHLLLVPKESYEATGAEDTNDKVVQVSALGVSCAVDADLFDDLKFLQCMRELQKENIFVIPELLEIMFGDKWLEVSEQLKEDGRVRATKAQEFISAIFEAVQAKNS